jgi:hypothetical protein
MTGTSVCLTYRGHALQRRPLALIIAPAGLAEIVHKSMSNIPSASTDAGRAGMAAGIATALLLALLALPALLWPNEFLRDDSYFYLQIADRIVEGQGSTFHGLTPTNGYHPLWMGGAIAAVAVAGGDREQSLLLVVLPAVAHYAGCCAAALPSLPAHGALQSGDRGRGPDDLFARYGRLWVRGAPQCPDAARGPWCRCGARCSSPGRRDGS